MLPSCMRASAPNLDCMHNCLYHLIKLSLLSARFCVMDKRIMLTDGKEMRFRKKLMLNQRKRIRHCSKTK